MAKKKNNNHNDFHLIENNDVEIQEGFTENEFENKNEVIDEYLNLDFKNEKFKESEELEVQDHEIKEFEQKINEIQNIEQDKEYNEHEKLNNEAKFDDKSIFVEAPKRILIGKVYCILKKSNQVCISTDNGNFVIPNNNYKINDIARYELN